MESVLFEIYEACSVVVSDHWHSLGMLRDSGSNFFSGSIAPLNGRPQCRHRPLSLSSFVRCGSGHPVKNFFAICGWGRTLARGRDGARANAAAVGAVRNTPLTTALRIGLARSSSLSIARAPVGNTPKAFAEEVRAEAAVWSQTISRGKLAVE